MINKIIMAGFLCLITSSIFAQKRLKINLQSKENTEVSPIVKEQVEEYATKINVLIHNTSLLSQAAILPKQ